jgi:hypothetical protein
MDVTRIESPDESWDRFVWDGPNGTIFHTLMFQSYHPPSKFEFVNLAVRDGDDLICIVPGGCVEVDSRKIFRSPVGASFAGFLFKRGCDLQTKAEAVRQVTVRLRASGFDGMDMILPPGCYAEDGLEDVRFLLTSCGSDLTLREASFVTRLAEIDSESLHPVLARNVRKAERSGVQVRRTRDPGDFYRVLVKNLSAKNVEPTHSLEELGRLVELFPERMVILEAVSGQGVVGGCLLMLCNDRVALAFYICDDPDERRSRITEAVLYRAMELLKASDLTYLDLGTISRSGETDWGLVRFKSKFGPRLWSREYYSLRFEEARS